MNESELLKIASKHPPLTDDLTEDNIDKMCDDAWLRLSKLDDDDMARIMTKLTTK